MKPLPSFIFAIISRSRIGLSLSFLGRCGDGRPGRPLELEGVALRIGEINGRALALGAIARDDLGRDAVRIQFRDYRLPVPRQHAVADMVDIAAFRSEEHTSELQSLMRISYAVFCLKKKITR